MSTIPRRSPAALGVRAGGETGSNRNKTGGACGQRPIAVEQTQGTVTVKVGNREIARTTNALTLREASYPPVQYVPLADVDPAVLRDSSTTTYCPYKGEASYYSVQAEDGEVLDDLIWTYREPYPAVAEIQGHVAFYPDRAVVDVEGVRG